MRYSTAMFWIASMATMAIMLLFVGCNSVLGIDDVAQCDVNADFNLVMPTPSTASLTHRMADGGPSLLFLLNTDATPDVLEVELYNGMGGHGTLNAPGTYTLNDADSELGTCGICATIYSNFDSTASTFSQTYFALGQGSITLSEADTAGIAGQMQNLSFRHVDITNGATTDRNDSCPVMVDSVRFGLLYSQ